MVPIPQSITTKTEDVISSELPVTARQLERMCVCVDRGGVCLIYVTVRMTAVNTSN